MTETGKICTANQGQIPEKLRKGRVSAVRRIPKPLWMRYLHARKFESRNARAQIRTAQIYATQSRLGAVWTLERTDPARSSRTRTSTCASKPRSRSLPPLRCLPVRHPLSRSPSQPVILSVCLSVCLSVILSVCHTHSLSSSQSVCLSACPSSSQSVTLTACHPRSLSVCLPV